MKLLKVIIIFLILTHCSFDNKSGIWQDEDTNINKNSVIFKDFKNVNIIKKSFKKIIPIKKDFKFKKNTSYKNYDWHDIYFSQSNNLKNFAYDESFNLISKSRKLTKYKIDNYFLVKNNNAIITDQKGNIIIFSIDKNKIIYKFNFYKKKYKKTQKKLNIIVNNNLLYVSDNLGYLYVLDLEKNKILWAKKYEIGFRSNIKIYKNKLATSNINNKLFYINKNNGQVLTILPTEETLIKNDFKNNLSLNDNLLFFINTFGTLYAINNDNMKILWFINLNQSLNLDPSNIFNGNQIVNYKDKLVVSTNEFTYIIDQKNGSTLHKKNFSSGLRPIILNDNLFIITRNNFLISLNINTGQIIYSYDLSLKTAKFLDNQKKKFYVKNFMFLNGKIVVFFENSYISILNIYGEVEQMRRLPSKINSFPIIINRSLLYLDERKKLSVFD